MNGLWTRLRRVNLGAKTIEGPRWRKLTIGRGRQPCLLFVSLMSLVLSVYGGLILPDLHVHISRPFVRRLLPVIRGLLCFEVVNRVSNSKVGSRSGGATPPPASAVHSG